MSTTHKRVFKTLAYTLLALVFAWMHGWLNYESALAILLVGSALLDLFTTE